MKWMQTFKSFENYLSLEKGSSNHTVRAYLSDLKSFSEYYTEKDPTRIKKADIQAYLYEIAEYLEPKTRARKLSSIRHFYDFLISDHFIESNPSFGIESPKFSKKLPDTLSFEEIEQIIESFDLSQPLSYRNKAILETLYGCGLRVSELTNLKISDLYFKEEMIKVTGKGNKQRLIPISKYTIDCINKYLNLERENGKIQLPFRDHVFLNRRGNALSRVMVFNIVKKQCSLVGIKKNVSPHTFRHSFASHLLARGADLLSIQLLLGHENLTTTEIYLHLDKSKIKDILEEYHPRAKN